jgi:hypothetical protein
MNPIKRLYRAFKYGANSPLTRPETAWMYQANIAPPPKMLTTSPGPLVIDTTEPRRIKNVTPQPLALQ